MNHIPSSLSHSLDAAIAAWDLQSWAEIAKHWRETIAVVDCTRWALANDGSDEAIELTKSKLNSVFNRNVRYDLHVSYQLAQAISHCALACIAYRDQTHSPNDRLDSVARHIQKAASIYDHRDVWGLSQIPIGKQSDPSAAIAGEDLSITDPGYRILACIAKRGAFGSAGITGPTWLTIQTLINHILGAPSPNPVFENTPKALMITGDHKGRVLEFQVSKLRLEKQPVVLPCFLDPLSFGVTPLRLSMRNSIWLAARCSKSSVNRESGEVVRLSLKDPGLCCELSGLSAGGLFAAAMIATMNEQRLDARKSTTGMLRFKNGHNSHESEPISSNDLELRPIRGVVAKIDQAWRVEHGIDEFFVTQKNYDQWNNAHPHCENPKVTPVGGITDLINSLMGPHRLDRELERHAQAIHERWAQAANWHEGLENGPESKLADLGFRYYIPQDLRIEGKIRSDQEQKDDQSDSNHPNKREETQVPSGADDDALLAVLGLSLQGRFWDNAPEWLRKTGKNRHIVLYDNAGAGKTVCSYRLSHLLTDPHHWERLFGIKSAPLVIRIEGLWPHESGSTGRLLTLREMLENQLKIEAKRADRDQANLVRDVIDYALSSRRVVVIIDGFDQFPQEDHQQIVYSYSVDPDGQNCHWIITSRVHSIDEHRTDQKIFDDRSWIRVRINPFTPEQQDQYFDKPDHQGKVIGKRWQRTLASRSAMGEILGLPMVLWMIRRLIEGSKSTPPIFATLSQLYLITSRMLLDRALKKNLDSVESRLKKNGIQIPPNMDNDAEKLQVLEHVLSLLGFQMMLMENYNGIEEGTERVKRFLDLCFYRYTKEIRTRYEEAEEFDHREIEEERDRAKLEWNWAIEVLKTIELYHRSVIEANHDRGLVFRNRKMVECHAARYLTRYATAWDIYGKDDASDLPKIVQDDLDRGDYRKRLETLCAWNYATHPQWRETWELAIDMPQEPISDSQQDGVIQHAVIDPAVACRSLSCLFRQPKAYRGRDIRPTRLMYLAWHLFEYDDTLLQRRLFLVDGKLQLGGDLKPEQRKTLGQRLLLGRLKKIKHVEEARDAVLENYRDAKSRQMMSEFKERFDTILVDGKRVPIPWDLEERKVALAGWQQASSWEKSRTLLQCPPQSWIEAYEAAKSQGNTQLQDPRINPAIVGFERHRFEPIRVAATTVTREMYRQFDPAFEGSEGNIKLIARYASAFDEYADDDAFPMIQTDWFDAWAFCKWLGPEVCLPEDSGWELACRGGTRTEFHFGDELDGTLANCDGNYPYRKGMDSGELKKGPYLQRTTPVGCERYPCNPFGLFDLHGNVWEWCNNGHRDSLVNRGGNREGGNAEGQEGSPRFLVGGSWNYFAIFTRCGYRFNDSPDDRYNNAGFRIVLR
jgi:formylglycine-generating enzyme required for sulfatase activity